MFHLHSPEGAIDLAQPYWLKIANFSHPLLFSTLARDDPFQIYGKALQILKLVFQAAEGEDLVIVACTVFD